MACLPLVVDVDRRWNVRRLFHRRNRRGCEIPLLFANTDDTHVTLRGEHEIARAEGELDREI
jgi:hypothetical protein